MGDMFLCVLVMLILKNVQRSYFKYTCYSLSTFVNRAQCSHLEPPFQTRRHFVAFGIELNIYVID